MTNRYVKRWVEGFLLTFSANASVSAILDGTVSSVSIPGWVLIAGAVGAAAIKATIQVGLMWSATSNGRASDS